MRNVLPVVVGAGSIVTFDKYMRAKNLKGNRASAKEWDVGPIGI